MRLYTRWLNLSQNLLLDVTNLRLFFSVPYTNFLHTKKEMFNIKCSKFYEILQDFKQNWSKFRKFQKSKGFFIISQNTCILRNSRIQQENTWKKNLGKKFIKCFKQILTCENKLLFFQFSGSRMSLMRTIFEELIAFY